MDETQRAARITGLLFLATFVTAIGALIAFQPVLDDPGGYVAGDGSDNRILLGALLELLSSSRTSAPPWCCTRS
ncbi:MAG: hypothetical protein M3546_14270 [Actinomycetota bacterium]|nr:hypothetical protein [Actinomycetota bacterium]